MHPDSMDSARADKWLWATRLFKTRSEAANACELEKIRRAGHLVKPATGLRPGDVIELPFPDGPGQRVIRVLSLIEKRVGAPLAQACYEELTAPSVVTANRQALLDRRAAGGRPTKKERRQIGRIRGFWE
jgi:ribosome-associated heat shock protein Hsp15